MTTVETMQRTITFYSRKGSDFLDCYGSDAIIVARELGLVRLTVCEQHATAKHPAGTSHTAIPLYVKDMWFAELVAKEWLPEVVQG